MKPNSIKILALAAIALSLGACGSGKKSSTSTSEGSQTSESQTSESATQSQSESTTQSESSQQEEAKLYEISEILSLDNDNQWEHLGELVRVENLALQGKYGKTLIGGAAVGEYISDLRGLQIDCAELPTFEIGSGWGADITVEGRLEDVNGRAVVTGAHVTVNSERVYNEEHTAYTGGLPVYMWPSQYMDRARFDALMGRKMSGLFLEGTFQIAALPATVTPEMGTSILAVFPGENLDAEDPDNYSILNFQVPTGLSEAACEAFNAYWGEKEVGGFFNFEGCGQWDTIENVGYGFVVDSWAAQSFEDPEVDPEIYTDWADVAADLNTYYVDDVPELGYDTVFSYQWTVYSGYAISDLFDDLTYVYVTDLENCLFSDIFYYVKPALLDDAFETIVTKAKAAGYEIKVEEEGAALLALTVDEVVISQIDVFKTDSSIEVYYFGIPGEIEEDPAEVLAAEVNAIFNPLVGSDILTWYDDYGCYIGGLGIGAAKADPEDAEAHQAELKSAAELIASYLPETLTSYGAEFEESEDDYWIGFVNADETAALDLYAYVNGSGNIVVQIQVYEVEAE